MAYGSVNVPGVTIAELEAVKSALQQTINAMREKIAVIENGVSDLGYSIADLESLVGDTAVLEQISQAIDAALKTNGEDKYALASALNDLKNLVGDTTVSEQISVAIEAAIKSYDENRYGKYRTYVDSNGLLVTQIV